MKCLLRCEGGAWTALQPAKSADLGGASAGCCGRAPPSPPNSRWPTQARLHSPTLDNNAPRVPLTTHDD